MEYMVVFKEPQSDFDRRHGDAYWGAWGAFIAALQHGMGLSEDPRLRAHLWHRLQALRGAPVTDAAT